MAGMLPGVEAARRRRVHQTGGFPDLPSSTRRSSICLYASNHESHLSSTSFQQRITLNQPNQDEKLGGPAREAKDRLDKRLRAQWKPDIKREISQESMKGVVEGRSSMVIGELHKEVFGSNNSRRRSKIFSWAKFGWKASDQAECAVCLEQFRTGETLVHLPCAHRFHSDCLVPWLETNAHCPCCRMEILYPVFL